jgi:hypothetical protein
LDSHDVSTPFYTRAVYFLTYCTSYPHSFKDFNTGFSKFLDFIEEACSSSDLHFYEKYNEMMDVCEKYDTKLFCNLKKFVSVGQTGIPLSLIKTVY